MSFFDRLWLLIFDLREGSGVEFLYGSEFIDENGGGDPGVRLPQAALEPNKYILEHNQSEW